MKFIFNGQEFDTDKPIYVLGFYIRKDFCIFRKNDDLYWIQECGPKTKKFYVESLNFKLIEGVNVIKSMKLITSKHNDSAHIDNDNIIGHSPQECLKLYKTMQEG